MASVRARFSSAIGDGSYQTPGAGPLLPFPLQVGDQLLQVPLSGGVGVVALHLPEDAVESGLGCLGWHLKEAGVLAAQSSETRGATAAPATLAPAPRRRGNDS